MAQGFREPRSLWLLAPVPPAGQVGPQCHLQALARTAGGIGALLTCVSLASQINLILCGS